MLTWLAWILIMGLLLICAFFALIYLSQDKTIFQTRPLSAEAKQRYQGDALSFKRDDGTHLQGWFRRHPDAEAPLLIYYGGNAEEISGNIDPLQQLDCSIALINYRGYGASGGKPSETILKEDALWLLDQISQQQAIPLQQIVLMGRSLGSGIASYVASERPVAAVILVTAFDSFPALARATYPKIPLGWLMKHRFESDLLAPHASQPLLNLTAGQDRIVPPAHARRLGSLWQGPVTTQEFPQADHINITEQADYWPSIKAFIYSR
ncbi:MAG: pimeloyl-ACP methyl ester carboxylesterase [Motiliproteus sp.]|jgi:pimeloyl-ACP methyl ester carboxylesterase